MSIPTPQLDDRRFQDLVDEAKRRIADRCPEWTDHNVSDPGVTLIELFAQMVDETLYRVNRLPEALLVTLMNAVGMRLQPARGARTLLTLWLTAPGRYWKEAAEDSPRLAARGLEVATVREADTEPVAFRTTEEARVHRAQVLSRYTVDAHSDRLRKPEGSTVAAFGTGRPTPGAALVLELARPLPGCAVRVELECEENRGTGIVPEHPPWAWETWSGGGWQPCELDRDTTGGLNRTGSVYLHLPPRTPLTSGAAAGSGWLRCRVTGTREGQASYEQSPVVGRVTADTIGVSVPASQADVLVRDDVVGVSDGSYGQPAFRLRHSPVVADGSGGPLLFAGSDPEPWRPVETLADSGEADRHYLLDRVAGELTLGVAVRERGGRMRRYGAVPPAGSPLRLGEYHVGGGARGNVRATALRVLRTPVPHVRSVENRHPASGGVDAETVEQAAVRLPLFLRRRTRAVTLADFADLTMEAHADIARAHAVSEETGSGGPAVHVVLVPRLPPDAGLTAPLEPGALEPPPDMMTTVARYLDERRLVGTQVLLTPVHLEPVRVRATLLARPGADPRQVESEAEEALRRTLHPLVGGEGGTGWPFGTDVQAGDVYAVLQRLPQVSRVESVALLDAADQEAERLRLPRHGLPLSLPSELVVS